MCDHKECSPARDEFVTLGGGLPGDPNGEQAALAGKGWYEGAMPARPARGAERGVPDGRTEHPGHW